jgi:DNA-binding response OmpR family regulator
MTMEAATRRGDRRRELVLIVDDSAPIRDVVSLLLADEGYDVITAVDGESGLEMAAEHDPDIIVLDVMMPGLDGRDVLARLRRTSDRPVLFLTARGEPEMASEGLDLGADDYVAKPFEPDELAARIRAVLRRVGPREETRTLVSGDLTIDFERRLVHRAGEPVQLGRTEWQVLRKLARNPGQVVLSTDMLRDIWGEGYADDLQVLRICISRLRRKLGATGRDDSPIRTYHNVGYALDVS